jgi:hypothetical protein
VKTSFQGLKMNCLLGEIIVSLPWTQSQLFASVRLTIRFSCLHNKWIIGSPSWEGKSNKPKEVTANQRKQKNWNSFVEIFDGWNFWLKKNCFKLLILYTTWLQCYVIERERLFLLKNGDVGQDHFLSIRKSICLHFFNVQ